MPTAEDKTRLASDVLFAADDSDTAEAQPK
jgi:hypothetical protein